MPPQKKKGAKVQVKTQQKIAKAQDQIQASTYQTQADDIESSHQDQIQYDNPFEEDIQTAITHQSPQKSAVPQESNINIKGRKNFDNNLHQNYLGQAPHAKAAQQEVLPEDVPLRQQPARTRRQLANQNNDTLVTKKVDRKVDEVIRSNDNLNKAQNSTALTRNAKKKENSDTKAKKNSSKIVIENSSQEEDIEDNHEEIKAKPEDLPLRQTRKNGQQESTIQIQSKVPNSRSQTINQAKQQPQQSIPVIKTQLPIQQQLQSVLNNASKISPTTVNDQKVVPKVAPPQNDSKENSGDKPNSGEKKKLTLREMEGLSKLLSIQVDGLKMKEQQMQNMLQNQNTNNTNNFRMNQNKIQTGQNGPNPNYSINNLLNGLQPRKLIKPNNDNGKQQIIQQNLNNLRSQMNDKTHIVIDDEYEDDIENQQFDLEGNGQDIDIENIQEVVPTQTYPQQQRMNRSQIDQRVPLRSITPQNKTMQQNPHYMNPRQNQAQQNVYGYQQNNNNNYYQRKSVTPTGKLGIPPQLNQNVGKVTPMGNYQQVGGKVTPMGHTQLGGKITPMNQKIQNQIMNPNMGQSHMMNGAGKITPIHSKIQNNGKTTPMNGMNGSGGNQNGGKRTPITYGNQQQQQQFSRFEIENEIQSRIETIKNNIGPLLACLNSDLIGGSAPSQQQPQQPQMHVQERDMNRRIYQDMRERRVNAYDQQMQVPNNQIQQQIRGRSVTPTIQTNRRHFDVDVHNNSNNNNNNFMQTNGQNMQRKITPIRGIQQQQQMTKPDHQQVPVGRNYDARAGDWLCGTCRNFNFAYRNICNRCGQQQDENIHMVHPQITQEAMDLIHELNHKGQKKTPIRTVDDVKRTFNNDPLQNKENLKNISNTNGPNNQNQDQQQRQTTLKPTTQGGVQQDTNLQINNRRQRITYKQFEEYENSLANSKILKETTKPNNETSSATNNNNNNIKDLSSKIESVGNQIVFIDNSSAQPIINNNNKNDSKNNKEQNEKQNNQTNTNNKQTKDQTQNNNQRKRVLDPRVQMR